jgi:type IV pilus assembly protein PilO
VGRSDRTILLLGLLVIVLLGVGYYFLLLSPLLGRLDQSAQARDAKQAQLANLRREVAQLEAVRRNASETERQLLELSKRVPTQPEIPTLVVQIEEIADNAGVAQLSIEPGTPGPPPGGGDYSVVPVTMSFEGTYDQLQLFLEDTRNLARLVTVNKVSYCLIAPSGGAQVECPVADVDTSGTGESTTVEGVEQMLKVEIEAEVYFQPSVEPSNVPATAAPAPPQTTTPQETTTPQPQETTSAP